MAIIRKFVELPHRVGHAHPTEVECGHFVIREAGQPTLLQLDTYGSDARQSRNKQSQTLQLDEDRARELISILRRAFSNLG